VKAAVPATTPTSQRGIRPVVPVLDMRLKKILIINKNTK
jgi:hypothetical protein